ncbi:protein-L-isoaspartate O-methyltransferase [Cnuella takakiae]|nr:protein-L-isoaspartate O-methyltransferase [Cnuella takakiae]
MSEKGRVLDGFKNLDPLFDKMSRARVVMLGEASHGTHEYYTWRTYITKKLITDYGFNFIGVEGDWPDCYAVNRYIKHKEGAGSSAEAVLRGYDRWPTWMWANWEITGLTEWLHQYNKGKSWPNQAGFYGLDVYSLWDSLTAVRQYLAANDPEALHQAEKAFRCFAPYKDDETSYAYAAQVVPQRCQQEVVHLLQQFQREKDGRGDDAEERFAAEQNALVTVNAEKYYRTMIGGGAASWNVRDSHMAETLERLMQLHGPDSKAIVWEHNTHIGDARATSMSDEGMYNIGELARKQYGKGDVFLLGFGSYAGSVMAATSWGAPQQVMEVPEARENSWEYHLHAAGGNRLLLSDDLRESVLAEKRLGHRAIGVVYRPQYEKFGNYVATLVPERYDGFIFLDQTKALHPLHGEAHNQKMPETYPFGV